jgi:hypothetical protein
LDEIPIIASESEESAHFCWVFGSRIVRNPLELLRVHLEVSFANDDTQVLDFLLLECALFWFDVQVICLQDVEYAVYQFSVPCYVLFLGLPRFFLV